MDLRKTITREHIVSTGVPVLFLGPTGCGKTTVAKEIADKLKLDFYYSHAVTDESHLLGYNDISGNYVSTPFYKAFTQGGVFLLDEMDASIPEALLILNMALANDKMSFPCGLESAHENFRVIASANTIDGASYEYTGRSKLDAASLDRFVVMHFDYNKNYEKQLIEKSDFDIKLYENFQKLRSIIKANNLNAIISTRTIEQFCKLRTTMSFNIFKMMFLPTNNIKDFDDFEFYYESGGLVGDSSFITSADYVKSLLDNTSLNVKHFVDNLFDKFNIEDYLVAKTIKTLDINDILEDSDLIPKDRTISKDRALQIIEFLTNKENVKHYSLSGSKAEKPLKTKEWLEVIEKLNASIVVGGE